MFGLYAILLYPGLVQFCNCYIGWIAAGIGSMTMSEFNHTPINVVSPIKGGATMGIYDITYFSNKMVFKGKTIAIRMNFVAHFNADKKIDRYNTYYDRSIIIKASGKNILEEIKLKK
ncbi:MAG: hypothetical protein ABI285_10775 [Ginsengibacter sp.]